MQLFDYLEFNAAAYPNKAALRINEREWSYSQVLKLSEKFLSRFRGKFQAGDRVAIWFNNSINWYVTFLTLQKLGVVAAPINTRLTASEVAQILEDLQASAIITVNAYRNRHYLEEARELCRLIGAGITLIDASDDISPEDWQEETFGLRSASASTLDLSDVLCIQYTSGTTSLPKGAMLGSAQYLQTAAHVAAAQSITPNTSFISAAPFFHCSGTMHAITVCQIMGCTLNSIDVWDPELFLWTTDKYQCDTSHMIYFRDVLALNSGAARHQLRSLNVSHELGTYDFLKRVYEELDIPGLSNLYGMTETCGQFAMWYADDDVELRLSSNGRPQPGNFLRIADPESGVPLSPGDLGEIQMRGRTLFKGYFNRPEANQQAWTADGWFRSGDLGRLSAEGQLHYLTRGKDIIRVGGENFAPAEVEQAIRDVTSFTQVCVLAVSDERLDEVPVAIVSGPSSMARDDMVISLRKRLASFKIPREFYRVDNMPITATNRIQKNVLKSWISEARLEKLV